MEYKQEEQDVGVLPHLEGPEPGYIACHLVLVTQSCANAIATLSRTLSIVDGYVVEATTTPPAQVRSLGSTGCLTGALASNNFRCLSVRSRHSDSIILQTHGV